MIKKIFCLVLICSTLTFSLEQTRTHTEYFPNGKIRLQGLYINNIKSGFWNLFNSEGYKIREYSYLNGEKLFRVTNYTDSGIIQSSGIIQNSKQEGEWLYYDKNGILISKLTFLNGVKHGHFTAYNTDSIPIVEGYFSNDVISDIRTLNKTGVKR